MSCVAYRCSNSSTDVLQFELETWMDHVVHRIPSLALGDRLGAFEFDDI